MTAAGVQNDIAQETIPYTYSNDIIIIFFFWPTSTKPVGTKKLSLFGMTPQKRSAGNVLLNAIAYSLSGPPSTSAGTDIASPVAHIVTSEIRFPRSWTNSTACTFQDPPVSTGMGANI